MFSVLLATAISRYCYCFILSGNSQERSKYAAISNIYHLTVIQINDLFILIPIVNTGAYEIKVSGFAYFQNGNT